MNMSGSTPDIDGRMRHHEGAAFIDLTRYFDGDVLPPQKHSGSMQPPFLLSKMMMPRRYHGHYSR